MGTVILHAGRPKAGSSSIQRWLENRSRWLRNEHRIRLLVMRDRHEEGAKGLHLGVYDANGVNSGVFVRRFLALREGTALARRFCDELDTFANRYSSVVVTSEAFATLFDGGSTSFLECLGQLGLKHKVRVAYYVRPQHASLEAYWRQWGFRSGQAPSDYLREVANRHDYLQTCRVVHEIAPSLDFEPRPLLRELLAGGEVVVDFAERFLGIAGVGATGPDAWSNVGFPLALVNLLQAAPPGSLWSDRHDNRALDRLRPIIADWDVPETPEIGSSRELLQQWCHDVFETGNRELIRAGGWPVDWFVPPLANRENASERSLDELDQLWSPDSIGNATLARTLLFRAFGILAER